MSNAPSLTGQPSGGRFDLVAAGAWTAPHARELEGLVAGYDGRSGFTTAVVDVSGIEAFDTYGAWLLERLRRKLLSATPDVEIRGLAALYEGLAVEVEATNRTVDAPAPRGNPFLAALEAVGRAAETFARESLIFLNMLGAVCAAFVAVLVRPRLFRLTSAVHHLDRVAWQAVPIILLITFLIGGIIAQQGFFHFRRFGADEYVVDMVGILVLRELGVLIVAIMVAGRSGSSYTAELGSMKMREEIDALRTMGVDPVHVLLLPRVLALVVALPLLTFIGSIAALYGGGLVAWLYGGMSPEIFVARLKDAISLTHFKVGMIKAPFMALAIGVIACAEGLKVKGSAESLGLQTTTSVVKSIFLVIVLDGVFAIFFASIGM